MRRLSNERLLEMKREADAEVKREADAERKTEECTSNGLQRISH